MGGRLNGSSQFGLRRRKPLGLRGSLAVDPAPAVATVASLRVSCPRRPSDCTDPWTRFGFLLLCELIKHKSWTGGPIVWREVVY
jgi:hypothetical protein